MYLQRGGGWGREALLLFLKKLLQILNPRQCHTNQQPWRQDLQGGQTEIQCQFCQSAEFQLKTR